VIMTSTSTPGTGLSSYVVGAHSAHTAPEWTEQGTGLSSAGTAALVLPVQVAFGARSTDLPGLPPRGAPV
jgi:hypothetical protein